VRDILTKRRWFGLEYLLAALLGVITPFCSCSSIPLFIGFVGAGIPLGVTFAFLISSPLVNESSLLLFPAIFGLKMTLIYNVVGVVISMLGGYLIQRLHMERYVSAELFKFTSKREVEAEHKNKKVPFEKLFGYWHEDAMNVTKQIFPYVLLGVGAGALIHGIVPEILIRQYLSIDAWWIVPVAVLMGVPLYASPISIIPVIEALVGKGVPMGTGLAFLTAAVTLSIPQILILKKVMKWQLLLTFYGITIIGIIFMGYLFNWITL
jgi:uncharacterized membrane protein YraQ (UPF0718 family)